ncbi:MAG: AI-2E family transporter [Anaerolineaceae bacterium]|nr:AI-2E family transporter [Anaerolineaceae bacterium]
MSKLKQYLDPKYTKISVYVIITAIITFVLCIILSLSGGFFKKFFSVIGLVLKPIIAGGVIAYLIEPLVQWIQKKLKFSRPIAVIGTFVVIVLLILAMLVMAGLFLGKQINAINFNEIGNLIGSFSDQLKDIGERVTQWFASHSIDIKAITGGVGNVVTGITGAASDIFFASIFAIYFLLDSDRIQKYWDRVRKLFVKPQTQAKIHEILVDADKCFSGYIRGQFLDAILVGVVTFIAMTICQVPYPFVIGLLTGAGNLIPYVGPVIGFATLLIVCLIENAWSKLLIGGIILAVLLFVDGNIINPKLLSSSIEIHPLLVFAAMIAGSAVGGLLGMLVAVPLAALLKIQFDKFIDRKEAEKRAESRKKQ